MRQALFVWMYTATGTELVFAIDQSTTLRLSRDWRYRTYAVRSHLPISKVHHVQSRHHTTVAGTIPQPAIYRTNTNKVLEVKSNTNSVLRKSVYLETS